MAERDQMYVMSTDWEKTQLFAHNNYDAWDVVDFSSFVLFNNGDQTFHNENGIWQEDDYILIPQSNCVVNFNGQLIFGGVKNAWNSLTENFIVWGNVGQLSAVIGQSFVAGFKDMQIGQILKLVDAGGYILCCGTEGIAGLYPTEKAVYFSYRKLSKVGISCKAAATEEFLITKDNKLFAISKDGLKELGYESYLSLLDMTKLRITKDPLTGDYYICDGIRNFIYTQGLLTQRSKMLLGMVELSGVLYSCYNATTENVEIQLAELTFNTAGQKQIDYIELLGEYIGTATGQMKVKQNHGDTIYTSKELPVNNDGVCYVRGTGNSVSPYVKISSPTKMLLSGLAVGIKFVDFRIRTQLQMVSGEQE